MEENTNNHKVIFGDSRKMSEVDDSSIHFAVTSPPYWCIKDYAHQKQIGYNQSYEDYLSSLKSVLSETFRVLHDGCRFAVNIGDQYLKASEHGRYRVQPIPSNLSIIGCDIGFDFMGAIIWNKISTSNPSGGGTWMGSTYYPKDGHITYEHEYILLFRKPGEWPKPSEESKEKSKLTKEQRSKWFRGMWDDIPPVKQDDHIAMFPIEIPQRLIKMYSFHGETILDPFLGSGTTSLAADKEGRNSIGYEINEDYEQVIKKRGANNNVTFNMTI